MAKVFARLTRSMQRRRVMKALFNALMTNVIMVAEVAHIEASGGVHLAISRMPVISSA